MVFWKLSLVTNENTAEQDSRRENSATIKYYCVLKTKGDKKKGDCLLNLNIILAEAP